MLDNALNWIMDAAKVVGIGLFVVALSLLGNWLVGVGPGPAVLTNEGDDRDRPASGSVERR
jgi:hypothetical protein